MELRDDEYTKPQSPPCLSWLIGYPSKTETFLAHFLFWHRPLSGELQGFCLRISVIEFLSPRLAKRKKKVFKDFSEIAVHLRTWKKKRRISTVSWMLCSSYPIILESLTGPLTWVDNYKCKQEDHGLSPRKYFKLWQWASPVPYHPSPKKSAIVTTLEADCT